MSSAANLHLPIAPLQPPVSLEGDPPPKVDFEQDIRPHLRTCLVGGPLSPLRSDLHDEAGLHAGWPLCCLKSYVDCPDSCGNAHQYRYS